MLLTQSTGLMTIVVVNIPKHLQLLCGKWAKYGVESTELWSEVGDVIGMKMEVLCLEGKKRSQFTAENIPRKRRWGRGREDMGNKAGYTATPVACVWAGAIFEVTSSFGHEQWGQRTQKPKKSKVWRTDGRTDEPTKRGVESRSTRLKRTEPDRKINGVRQTLLHSKRQADKPLNESTCTECS